MPIIERVGAIDEDLANEIAVLINAIVVRNK